MPADETQGTQLPRESLSSGRSRVSRDIVSTLRIGVVGDVDGRLAPPSAGGRRCQRLRVIRDFANCGVCTATVTESPRESLASVSKHSQPAGSEFGYNSGARMRKHWYGQSRVCRAGNCRRRRA